MFKVGIGTSKNLDIFLAGEEAARKAILDLGTQNPDLCFLFSSPKFAHPQMISGVRTIINNSPLFGCSDAGEISSSGDQQRSIAIAAIRSDNLDFSAHLEEDIDINPRQKGQRIAKIVKEGISKGIDKGVFIILSDGLSGVIDDVLRGAQEVLGTSFPILGGGAGDDFLFQKTYQYYNNEIFTKSALGILIKSSKIGFGMRHGWHPLGKPYKVSRAQKNVVWELDGRSAIEIYQNYFGEQIMNLEEKMLMKMLINYPLGMSIPGEKEYLVRNILEFQLDGSLVFSSEIPEGRQVRLMMGNKNLAIHAARDATWQATQRLLPQEIKIGIIFNSASRYKLLGKERNKEIEEIKKIAGEIPLIGFYGYNQQAPLSGEINLGQSYSHNQALVFLALGE